jgi:hypothetical protein
MQRGWLRVTIRYSLAVLVEQGRLGWAEAARAPHSGRDGCRGDAGTPVRPRPRLFELSG